MSLVDTNDGQPMGLAVIPQNPAALDRVEDPAAVMVALVDQARTMLAQATGMEGLADVIEWKSRAEAIRVYTQQKDMGHEAELSAAEIVRRAERRIGQLIREGQAAGEVRRRGEHQVVVNDNNSQESPSELAAMAGLNRAALSRGVYPMTDDVTEAEFEAGIAAAKAEGDLSRANVVRKVKGEPKAPEPPRNLPLKERADQIRALAAEDFTSPQIADRIGVSPDRVRDIAKRAGIDIPADAVFGGKFRKVDPNQIIESVIELATPERMALARVAYSELDRERIPEWIASLEVAIKALQAIKSNLKGELTREQA